MDVFETVLKTSTISDEIFESPTHDTFDPLGATTAGKTNDVVDAVLDKLKNAKEIVVGISECNTYKQCFKPKPGETPEQQERRLMRQRIKIRKNRLLLQLEVPDKAQAERERATQRARLMRQKKKAEETPEETAARKLHQRSSVATTRKRIKELETPEQLAERKAKQNERKKLRIQEMTAKETPEQRAERKKIALSYREKYRQNKLAMKTGKIRGQKKIKIECNKNDE